MTETIFRNGRVVLPETIHDGDVVVRDGMIAEIADAGIGVAGIDLEGDWLLPGLVELHTDHIEGHYAPRPKVRWNPSAAAHAHDAQIASSGITTVLDALRIGMDEDSQLTAEDMKILGDAIASGQERG
ncbi:MAG: alpha-D-ribose 1-methylphosphonate 5-triphosphate diphosphatase, partial [Bauldia litoralis]